MPRSGGDFVSAAREAMGNVSLYREAAPPRRYEGRVGDKGCGLPRPEAAVEAKGAVCCSESHKDSGWTGYFIDRFRAWERAVCSPRSRTVPGVVFQDKQEWQERTGGERGGGGEEASKQGKGRGRRVGLSGRASTSRWYTQGGIRAEMSRQRVVR